MKRSSFVRPALASITIAPVAFAAAIGLACCAMACTSSSPPVVSEQIGHSSAATLDDQRADQVFGQPGFTSGTEPTEASVDTVRRPAGLAFGFFDGVQAIAIADRGNHRIRTIATGTVRSATSDFLLGQPWWDTGEANLGAGPSYFSLSAPSAVALSTEAFYAVADTDNHRVLIGFIAGSINNVVGQHLSYLSGERNAGGLSASSLAEPKGVAWSSGGFGTRLWIADSGNHRLLAYRYSLFTAAEWVIGQHDGSGASVFTKGEPNDGNPTPSAKSLRDPRGVAATSDDFSGASSPGVYVADTGNHRVLHFGECSSVEITTPCQSADRVYGQRDYQSADPSAGGVSALSLDTPTAVAIDRLGGLWIADTGNNRVLHYKRGTTSADRVLGQPDFTTGAAPTVITDRTLSAPTGVAVDDDDNLFVADTGANRIVRYRFIATPASCDDGDPCTNDIVTGGVCFNQLTSEAIACAPFRCDTGRHVCADNCYTFGCQGAFVCTSSGKCVESCRTPDSVCSGGGMCVDGWCCDRACAGTCEACNVVGAEGTCAGIFGSPSAIAVFGSPKRVCAREGLDDPECAGQCDGRHRDACVPAAATTACGPETCNDGIATLRGGCDGHGRCISVTQTCAPYACAPNGCRTECTDSHHCATGADCVDGQCVGASDEKIGGVGCNVRSDSMQQSTTISWSILIGGLTLSLLVSERRRRARR